MHSLWQAALLLLLYLLFDSIIKRNDPVIKRNILFSLLFAQLVLFISTFFIYYTGSTSIYIDQAGTNFSALLNSQPLLEKTAPWLIALYAFVLMYKSVHLIVNWRNFRSNSRSSWIKPSIDLRVFTGVKAMEFGIRRKVSLWYSSKINTAMTFGFFKPVILLPVALLNNLSIEETETLIIHELTHIRNNDYFLNWLLVACETIFFFNPFIHIIGKKIRLEREKNCDAQVLQFNYPAINYAETLLKAATFKTNHGSFFLAAATKHAQLLERIQFFTKENNLRFYKRNYTGIALLPLIMVFAINLFLLDIIRHKEIAAPVTEEQHAISIAGLENEGYANTVSTNAFQLAEKAKKLAEEAYKLSLKEKENAQAMKKMAESAEQEILVPDEPDVESIAMPAAVIDADDTKEVTLKEENSATGKSVTKVYKMKFVNGEWKTTLLWTISERRPGNDSCIIIRDTSHYFNRVQ